MNFRVNLAVAFAAAFAFACAEKPANIPELEAATQPRPGMQLLGLYAMKVTPVEGSGGKLFAMEPVPVGRDGNPSTNPRGTIQVGGTFGSVTTAGPGGCAGVNALTAAVRITNFAVDPLRNVWADVVDMSGNTGNTACNSTPSSQSEGQFSIGDMTQGIWKYSDLPGSAVADGSVAGGTSLPLAAAPTGGVWGFRYVTLTPFQFYFTVWADNSAPTLTPAITAGPTQPLTWTSNVVSSSALEICAADPGANFQAPCPAGQGVAVANPIAGSGAGPWTFTYAPTGLTGGQTYWWRATNVFPVGTGTFHSPWSFFTFSAAQPTVANATFQANDAVALGFNATLTWTTPAVQTDTWVVLCQGTCPVSRPAVPGANILFDGPALGIELIPGTSDYSLDVSLLLATDAVTGYLIPTPTVTYDFRVYNYDGFSAAPLYAATHASGTITVTPVAAVPTITSTVGTAIAPVGFSIANNATFTVTWTSDLLMPDTVFELLDLNDPNGLPYYTSPAPPAAGAMVGVPNVPVNGVNNYAVDLKPLSLGVGNYTITIYNNDLVGTVGAVSYFDVAL